MRGILRLQLTALAWCTLGAWSLASTVGAAARAHSLAFLLGHSAIETQSDREPAGSAEAFPFRSAKSGTVREIYLYLDRANRASVARVAIYSTVRGRPGSLLAAGSARSGGARGWTRIGLSAARLTHGRRYWIAVLGTGGTLAYRDRRTAGCRSQESAQKGLMHFPARWTAGHAWQTCFLSAYAMGQSLTRGGSTGSGPSGSPTAPGSGGPTPPTGSPPIQKNCISRPSTCGYPDATNTGVPAGTPLTNSGSITVTTPGAVISRLDVSGTIYVNADNVTIKDSQVTNSSPSSWAIHVDSHVSGTVIEDTTVRGRDAGPNAVEYAISNGGTDTRAIRVRLYHCTECYAGAGLLKDSYAITDATVSGAHYEAIYYGGGSEALNVQHNTLLNPHQQTASVYAGTDFGPQQNLVINNNLLAGGGYVIYAGEGNSGTRNVQITNNRFSTAYFTNGGYYGLDAYVSWPVTTWIDNYWDTTLRSARGQ